MLALMRIVHCLYAVSCYDTNEYGFGCDQCNYKTRKPLVANGKPCMVGVVLHIFRCFDNLFYFAQYSSMHGIHEATQLAYRKSYFIDRTHFKKISQISMLLLSHGKET